MEGEWKEMGGEWKEGGREWVGVGGEWKGEEGNGSERREEEWKGRGGDGKEGEWKGGGRVHVPRPRRALNWFQVTMSIYPVSVHWFISNHPYT